MADERLSLFPTPNKDKPVPDGVASEIWDAANNKWIGALATLCEEWAGNMQAIEWVNPEFGRTALHQRMIFSHVSDEEATEAIKLLLRVKKQTNTHTHTHTNKNTHTKTHVQKHTHTYTQTHRLALIPSS